MKGLVAALVTGVVLLAVARVAYLIKAPVLLAWPVEIEVSPGQSPANVARNLEDQGVVRSGRILLLLTRLHGDDRRIRHGVHRFEGTLRPRQVIEELLRSPQPTVRVTVPEGLTWREIGQLLEQQTIVSADEYGAAVCDPGFLALAGASPTANCAEGYLFPDTYRLSPGMTAPDIARLQLARFEQVIGTLLSRLTADPGNALIDALGPRAKARAWRSDPAVRRQLLGQVIVLASIVEKETSLPKERPLIASVFHNRLRADMRLQADPTVIYGLALAGTPWDGKSLSRHIRKPAPYNTYTRDGLPPGPICNPGRGAIEATLFPAATDYLYFVADGNGAHRFSKTLVEHNKAVTQLRRR